MTSVRGASEAIGLPAAGASASAAGGVLRRRRSRGPFFRTARSPEEAPRKVVNAMLLPRGELGRHHAQHRQTGQTLGDFTHRGDGGFVLAFDARCVSLLT